MIISENWLREWVDFDASFEELPELLTQVGLEAGAVSIVPSLPKGIVAGRVDLVAQDAAGGEIQGPGGEPGPDDRHQLEADGGAD